jgi:tripartite-type tricarboxylate transporter receptor subunit TctC
MTVRTTHGLISALVLGLTLMLVGRGEAFATDYPTKPVRLIIPFGAGGSIDLVARLIAESVGARWHQRMIIENRAGADGDLGAAFVTRSRPDGQTLLATSQAIASNVSLHPARPYDVETQLAAIMLLASTNSVFFASPVLHANSIADFVEVAKARPGKLNYGSQGIGTSAFLTVELFKLQAGLDIFHIPYSDYAQQTSALLTGDIAMVSVTVPQALALTATGRLRPLAVSGPRRSEVLPDVPTMREVGFANYEASTWYGLYAPAGTPKETIEKINLDFKTALDRPDIKERLAQLGIETIASSPDDLRSYLTQEIDKWAKVIKAAGIQVRY